MSEQHELFDDKPAITGLDRYTDQRHRGTIPFGYDRRSGSLGVVGVFHTDGDAGIADRGDGLLVEYVETDRSQLAHFAIGHRVDHLGVGDDAGVSHEHARHVGPILIQLGMHAPCHDRSGDVASTTGEGFYLPQTGFPIESRKHIAPLW
ncbi:hypothetical protein SDC9_176281 [bioreactor metagenome]|uniref:Uncharacterized protein n=1 Tax=bioreactor metagenome TaxID=1076179 RepID=A0A645GRJ0_9ZZZZ